MRRELTYTEGLWWYRQQDSVFAKNVILGDWDSEDDYTQVTESEKARIENELSEKTSDEMLNELNTIVNG